MPVQLQEHAPTTGSASLTFPFTVGDNRGYVHCPNSDALSGYTSTLPMLLFRRLSDDFNLPGMPGHSIRHSRCVACVRDEDYQSSARGIRSSRGNDERERGRADVCRDGVTNARRSSLFANIRRQRLLQILQNRRPRIALTTPDCVVVLDHISGHLARRDHCCGTGPRNLRDSVRSILRECSLSPWAFRSNRLCQPIAPGAGYGRRVAAGIAVACANSPFKSGFSSQASFRASVPSLATGITPGEYRSDRQ